MSDSDQVWNRACGTEGGRGVGDEHLHSLISVHSIVMNGGTDHAAHHFDPLAFERSASACEYLGLASYAGIMRRIPAGSPALPKEAPGRRGLPHHAPRHGDLSDPCWLTKRGAVSGKVPTRPGTGNGREVFRCATGCATGLFDIGPALDVMCVGALVRNVRRLFGCGEDFGHGGQDSDDLPPCVVFLKAADACAARLGRLDVRGGSLLATLLSGGLAPLVRGDRSPGRSSGPSGFTTSRHESGSLSSRAALDAVPCALAASSCGAWCGATFQQAVGVCIQGSIVVITHRSCPLVRRSSRMWRAAVCRAGLRG
jgi:hypothetical protein